MIVYLHTNIQSCLDARSHYHGLFAQQTGQRLVHHKVDARHYAGENSPGDLADIVAIESKQIHKVNADLVCGLTTVRVDGGQEFEIPALSKEANTDVGVPNVNSKQHTGSPFRFFFIITRFFPKNKTDALRNRLILCNGIPLYRIIQIRPPLPSLMMRSRASRIFF